MRVMFFISELLDHTGDEMRTNEEIFEATQGTVETLFDYHLEHDTDEFGGRVGVYVALEAAMEDVRAFDVSEDVITLHMRRLRSMMGI